MNSYIRGWKNIFNFRDRDTRKQFFIFQFLVVFLPTVLFIILAFSSVIFTALSLGTLATLISSYLSIINIVFFIYSIACIIPIISSTARRLHDIGKSGWWQLLLGIPIIGLIFLIYIIFKRSDGDNQYGPAFASDGATASMPSRKRLKKSKRAKKETIPGNIVEPGNDYIPSLGTIDFTVRN